MGLSASMGLFFLSDDVGELVASRSQGPAVTQIESVPPPAVEPPKAKFDFYQLLPEMEVKVEEGRIEETRGGGGEGRKEASKQTRKRGSRDKGARGGREQVTETRKWERKTVCQW